ncbi:MAG: response regulator [Defluviitaleaceae bacterium]|nr:response regulator [Defluviitaleaceae bacterium]
MTGKKKVLIADGNPLNTQALVSILHPEHECIIARTGAEALETSRKILPDIILLEMLMPDMDGYEVLTALKRTKSTKQLPVICITGISDDYNEERGLALGAADYIRRTSSAAIIKLRVRRQLLLISALQAAEKASRAKSEFLVKMSHEIRTPMNSVMGVTNIMLQKGRLPPETEEAFLQIRAASDMLLSLVNNVLDLSKIEAGKPEIASKEYDTAGMIAGTVRLNLAHIGKKNINFTLDIDENLPVALIGDEIRIKQILNNLLSNAFKYTDRGEVKLLIKTDPPVSLEVLEKDRQDFQGLPCGAKITFEISDTGHGLSPEQVNGLFTEYTRFNEGNRHHIEGTGLGLSIVRRLVTAMGGEISVESIRGKGSTFRVEIPQKIKNQHLLGRETADALEDFCFPESTKYFEYEPMPHGRVLVVDDLESNLQVARGLLEPYEITVETVSSGEEAVSRIKNGEIFDIIFMDYMMPDMSGAQAAKILRDRGYTKPIVALTANVVAADLQNFDGFVSKPIDINVLNSCLVKFICEKSEIPNRVSSIFPGNSQAVTDSFYRDAKRIFGLLDSFMKKDNLSEREIEIFTINVHGLKSALANVGEARLSQDAAWLEQAGRDADLKIIRGEAPEFLINIHNLIKNHKEETPDEDIILSQDETAFLHENALQAADACIVYDDDTAYKILDKLKPRAWPFQIKKIIDKINEHLLHGDYEKAAEAAMQLKQSSA